MKEDKETFITTDLRKELKKIFATELKKLPEYLNDLHSKEKLDYLIKLMPFVHFWKRYPKSRYLVAQ